MRPLLVILVDADATRARAAIGLAAAQAALGGKAHLHLDAGAIPVLGDRAVTIAVEDACALGAVLSLCPTGLADHAALPPRFPDADRYGLVSLLGELADDARLVVI